jgi:hypothetical protein
MSREEEDRIEDLKDVEAALASLVPRGGRIDRDRLMFLAGQASVGARAQNGIRHAARWAWPSGFAAMTAVAATLLVMLLARPEPQAVVRIVESTQDSVPSIQYSVLGAPYAAPSTPNTVPSTQYSVLSPDSPARDSYHELLARVLAKGLDAWEPPAGGSVSVPGAAPLKYRDLLETMLDSPSS